MGGLKVIPNRPGPSYVWEMLHADTGELYLHFDVSRIAACQLGMLPSTTHTDYQRPDCREVLENKTTVFYIVVLTCVFRFMWPQTRVVLAPSLEEEKALLYIAQQPGIMAPTLLTT